MCNDPVITNLADLKAEKFDHKEMNTPGIQPLQKWRPAGLRRRLWPHVSTKYSRDGNFARCTDARGRPVNQQSISARAKYCNIITKRILLYTWE